jgi:hypothetical protein
MRRLLVSTTFFCLTAILAGSVRGWAQDSPAALIDSLVRPWPEKDRLAYEQLNRAARIYIYERCIFEVNTFPSSWVALMLQEEDDLNEAFRKTLFAADHCLGGIRCGTLPADHRGCLEDPHHQ